MNSPRSVMFAPWSMPLATDRPPTVAQSSVPAARPCTPSAVPENCCHWILYHLPRFGATSGNFIITYLMSSSGIPQPIRIVTGLAGGLPADPPDPSAANAPELAPPPANDQARQHHGPRRFAAS